MFGRLLSFWNGLISGVNCQFYKEGTLSSSKLTSSSKPKNLLRGDPSCTCCHRTSYLKVKGVVWPSSARFKFKRCLPHKLPHRVYTGKDHISPIGNGSCEDDVRFDKVVYVPWRPWRVLHQFHHIWHWRQKPCKIHVTIGSKLWAHPLILLICWWFWMILGLLSRASLLKMGNISIAFQFSKPSPDIMGQVDLSSSFIIFHMTCLLSSPEHLKICWKLPYQCV